MFESLIEKLRHRLWNSRLLLSSHVVHQDWRLPLGQGSAVVGTILRGFQGQNLRHLSFDLKLVLTLAELRWLLGVYRRFFRHVVACHESFDAGTLRQLKRQGLRLGTDEAIRCLLDLAETLAFLIDRLALTKLDVVEGELVLLERHGVEVAPCNLHRNVVRLQLA